MVSRLTQKNVHKMPQVLDHPKRHAGNFIFRKQSVDVRAVDLKVASSRGSAELEDLGSIVFLSEKAYAESHDFKQSKPEVSWGYCVLDVWQNKSDDYSRSCAPTLHLGDLQRERTLLGLWDSLSSSVQVNAVAAQDELSELIKTLDSQAKANATWLDDDLAELSDWVLEHRDEAFQKVMGESHHGRLRWAILESLALKQDDKLRKTLCELAEDSNLDPWLLNGVSVVIRMTPMKSSKVRVTEALRSRLMHASSHMSSYLDHVKECGVGELLMTFGSFALPSDFELLWGFASGSWKLKARVCAFDALRRTTLRYAKDAETDDFFQGHRQALVDIGTFLAGNFRTSADDGALFLAWLTTILSRMGPEAELVEPILQKFPRHASRVLFELKQVWGALKQNESDVKCRYERLDKLAKPVGGK